MRFTSVAVGWVGCRKKTKMSFSAAKGVIRHDTACVRARSRVCVSVTNELFTPDSCLVLTAMDAQLTYPSLQHPG